MIRRALLALLIVSLSGCASTLRMFSRETPTTQLAQGVFVACRAVDVVTTLKIIGAGGKELNPFMAGFVHSIPQFILVQALLSGLIIWLESQISEEAALLATAASCIAPIHNLGQL